MARLRASHDTDGMDGVEEEEEGFPEDYTLEQFKAEVFLTI
jgi:hypothetical protein